MESAAKIRAVAIFYSRWGESGVRDVSEAYLAEAGGVSFVDTQGGTAGGG